MIYSMEYIPRTKTGLIVLLLASPLIIWAFSKSYFLVLIVYFVIMIVIGIVDDNSQPTEAKKNLIHSLVEAECKINLLKVSDNELKNIIIEAEGRELEYKEEYDSFLSFSMKIIDKLESEYFKLKTSDIKDYELVSRSYDASRLVKIIDQKLYWNKFVQKLVGEPKALKKKDADNFSKAYMELMSWL